MNRRQFTKNALLTGFGFTALLLGSKLAMAGNGPGQQNKDTHKDAQEDHKEDQNHVNPHNPS